MAKPARGSPSRKTHAAGVQDHDAVHLDVELNMRMADAHDVSVDVLEPPRPHFGVFEQILVERVAWSRMDQEEPFAAQRESLRHWQL